MTAPTALAVVIPAHDEEELIGACLDSIRTAVARARGLVERVSVHVALDACSDETARIAIAAGADAIVPAARGVGAARAAGVAAALAAHEYEPPRRLWIAHTDADSVVPANWLTHQWELATGGADIVVGTVRPDFRDLSAEQIAAWWATHVPGTANGHVHGANLGTRASTLVAAGGFEPVLEHEDVWLVAEALTYGAHVEASDEAWVQTSGRPFGRTSGGYAGYLREQLIPLARARADFAATA
ncbi:MULTISPECIES: glycosyltransferase [Bacteria]